MQYLGNRRLVENRPQDLDTRSSVGKPYYCTYYCFLLLKYGQKTAKIVSISVSRICAVLLSHICVIASASYKIYKLSSCVSAGRQPRQPDPEPTNLINSGYSLLCVDWRMPVHWMRAMINNHDSWILAADNQLVMLACGRACIERLGSVLPVIMYVKFLLTS